MQAMHTGSEVSKQIKKELKATWPKLKFSVRYDSFSGGDSVHIGWNFGPTTDQVDDVVRKYQYGRFNGMEDIYEYNEEDNALVDAQGNLRSLGGVKYVST